MSIVSSGGWEKIWEWEDCKPINKYYKKLNKSKNKKQLRGAWNPGACPKKPGAPCPVFVLVDPDANDC